MSVSFSLPPKKIFKKKIKIEANTNKTQINEYNKLYHSSCIILNSLFMSDLLILRNLSQYMHRLVHTSRNNNLGPMKKVP